jgi:glucose 1-dehydrogenase
MQIANNLRPALAVISGGLGDIGLAIAGELQAAGAKVALADLSANSEKGDFYGQLDVTDFAAVEKWYDAVTEKFGCVPNLIIPNAATATFKRYFEVSSEEWCREIDVNLNGAFHFANAGASRLLKSAKPGRIVLIGSWAGHAPHKNLPAYSVSKAGLRMLTKTLALELAPRGILVNEVAPGYVHAGLSGRVFSEKPEIAEISAGQVPVRHLISAVEVARQVLFLCSGDAEHFAGMTLLQDGGLSLIQGPSFE